MPACLPLVRTCHVLRSRSVAAWKRPGRHGKAARPKEGSLDYLRSNHPQNRGGITKVIEAVRQLRGEAHPEVQVANCTLALASGPGLVLGGAHAHATLILERE